jgi:hypothetical protein
MCAGAESVVLVFHGALHPLRDGCLRLQICPFCGSGSIPLFFDNERPGLHLQPGALCCQKVLLFDLTLFRRCGGERLRGF